VPVRPPLDSQYLALQSAASASSIAARLPIGGLLSTLAVLHGARAREFLNEQGVNCWVLE